MSLSRAHRRFTTWLTLFALVLGTLAPTLVQAAVASSDRSDWVEVCSASGMVWVRADAEVALSEQPAAPSTDQAMHCPWCTLHGGAIGLLPSPVQAAEVDRQPESAPAFFRAVTPSTVWAAARARAPPPAL